MTAEAQRADELFTLLSDDGLTTTTYEFVFPQRGGALGVSSSSPFAPKSTSGERSLGDYDPMSVIAFADLSSGMGQERMVDATRYLDAVNVDARSGSLVLGPQFNVTPAPDGTHALVADGTQTWIPIYTTLTNADIHPAWAVKVVRPADVAKLYTIYLPLKLASGATCTVEIQTDDSGGILGIPAGTVLATATLTSSTLGTAGQWYRIAFATPADVSGQAIYWIVVRNNGSIPVSWWGCYPLATPDPTNPVNAYYDLVRGGWNVAGDAALWWQADDATVRPDSTPFLLTGAGGDNVPRMWAYAGRSLYYVDHVSALMPVGASTGGATKVLGGDIKQGVWYQSSADTHPWLYLGTASAAAIEKFNGDLSNITWTTLTGHYMTVGCVHNKLLAYCVSNAVDLYDGTNWGAGTFKVGDATYPVANLVSWQGYLWAGKADGLYRITVPDGYPASTSTALTCIKVLDFSALATDANFYLFTEYQGDLIFSIGNGLMRFTSGNVLTSIGPDIGLDTNATKRLTYRAAAGTVNTLWCMGEGNVEGDSVLYAYAEGHWHPLVTLADPLYALTRSLCLEPGWYGDYPRIWFGAGIRVGYVDMPMNTDRRWTWSGIGYAPAGSLYLSWLDGNIRSIEKDWYAVIIDAEGVYRNPFTFQMERWIDVYSRTADDQPWTPVGLSGEAVANGLTTLHFPVGSHSHKLQLRIDLHGAPSFSFDPNVGATPRVLAVVLKYMERPEDAQTFTRTYQLSDRLVWRNNMPVASTLAEQFAALGVLREAKEPLTFTTWFGGTYTGHIVNYQGSELPDRYNEIEDKGAMLVTVTFVVLK